MRQVHPLLCAFTLIVGLPRVNASGRPHDTPPKTKVPEIAQFMGVRVGYDTMQRLEQILGPGLPMTGGHPGGARIWRVKGTNLELYADGFSSFGPLKGRDLKGRVIDVLRLEETSGSRNASGSQAPVISPGGRLTFLEGRISLGMTRRQVLKAIKGLLSWPFRNGDTWYWERKGYVFVQDSETKTKWLAQLIFRKGRVSEIHVESD